MSDYSKRQLSSYGPNFRIDVANPQNGLSGKDVYKMYGVTDDGSTQSCFNLSSSGQFSIHNDRNIEIVGGTDHGDNDEDITIIGRNGNISITANGMVRIRASSIMLEADDDVHIKAGRNVSIQSGSGRTLIEGNRIDISAPTGTLIDELGKGFLQQVFEGSKVGTDVLQKFVGGIAGTVLTKVLG